MEFNPVSISDDEPIIKVQKISITLEGIDNIEGDPIEIVTNRAVSNKSDILSALDEVFKETGLSIQDLQEFLNQKGKKI